MANYCRTTHLYPGVRQETTEANRPRKARNEIRLLGKRSSSRFKKRSRDTLRENQQLASLAPEYSSNRLRCTSSLVDEATARRTDQLDGAGSQHDIDTQHPTRVRGIKLVRRSISSTTLATAFPVTPRPHSSTLSMMDVATGAGGGPPGS